MACLNRLATSFDHCCFGSSSVKYSNFERLRKGLAKCRDYIFNFLENPAIPPDNNASERGIRKLKIKAVKDEAAYESKASTILNEVQENTSTCSWIGHLVSGLLHATSFRPVQTRSRFASGTEYLKLATYNNSPDRSTKSTSSPINGL